MKKLFYLIAIAAVAGFVLSSCTNTLEAVKIDDKWGFANTAKKVVIPCQYDDVREFSEGFATVKQDGKWGVINTKGDVVVSCKYDDAYSFSNGFAKVKKDGKYGFINTQGELVISCQYDEANDFAEGKSKVMKGGIWGYVDEQGVDTFRGPAYEQELQKIAEEKRKVEEERRKREEEERKRREEEERKRIEEVKKRGPEWLQGDWRLDMTGPNGMQIATYHLSIHGNNANLIINGETIHNGEFRVEGNELYVGRRKYTINNYKQTIYNSSYSFRKMSGGKMNRNTPSNFRTSNDVLSYLSGRVFYNGDTSLTISYDAVYVNGRAITAAPRVINFSSNRAIIIASSPYNGGDNFRFEIDSSSGTVTQNNDVFRE